MKRELFNEIFDNEVLPFIREMQENNPMIVQKDLAKCKTEIFSEYNRLNNVYKHQIFNKDEDGVLLDRHKIAACMCGAFLRVSVFNKTKIVEYIKKERQGVEAYFYYVNEFVALFAAVKFLSFFMIAEQKGHPEVVKNILDTFPMAPPVRKVKKGFWNSVLFNLAQVKMEEQIGLEHYDVYSYAMFFFWLETYFLDKMTAGSST